MPNPNLLSPRRKTRTVHLGSVPIGSEHPVSVQSMTKGETENVERTLAEIRACEEAGVDIMRVAVPYQRAANALPALLEQVRVPIVADIHFNPKMAFEAMKHDISSVRINPGNISDREIVTAIVKEAKNKGLHMRIGVNSGSIVPRKGLTVEEIEADMVDFMVEQALHWVNVVDDLGFHNFTLSIKSSDVNQTIAANRRIAGMCDVPLHLGVTHAGTPEAAKLKTALAFGTLLAEGIGDTLRVSITGSSEMEVTFCNDLLADLGMRERLLEVIACPSCGRADVDVEEFTLKLEKGLKKLGRKVRISFLGCAVNGPGEAAEADFGIVASNRFSMVYKGREMVGKIENDKLVDEFLELLERELPQPAPA